MTMAPSGKGHSPADRRQDAGQAEGHPPRILLVDDRADNLLALQAVLEPLGLDLAMAASGEEALRRLLVEEFTVIVLDVQMPGLDGFETARLIKLREKTRHIPIIFLTAISGDEEHHLEGYASGAIDYVYKPFEPAVLRAKVAALVELMAVRQRLEQEVAERTASERRLVDRERQLAEAESLAHVGAWTWDPGSGVVTWSDELFRIFELAPQSVPLSYDSYLEYVHPDDRAMVKAAFEHALTSGDSKPLEHRAVRSDGSTAWIRAQGQAVAGNDGSRKLFGAAQDITQRKRAEEEFTRFFDLSLDLMAVAALDGRLQRVNRSFSRVLGWTEDELLTRSYLDLVHAGDREAASEALGGLRAGREITDLDVRMRQRDGGHRWFRLSARPVPEEDVAYTVAIDITERKRAALLLAESEERYRALVEHAPEAIVVLDLGNGEVVDVNPEADRLFGRAGGSGDSPTARWDWIHRARTGETEPFEWSFHDAGGSLVLCEVRLLPLSASDRRLARVSLIDVTERRRAEEAAAALLEGERALRQAQQIAQTLQRGLLPERLPEIPGMQLAARYLAGSAGLEVGGDWYDVIPMPSGAIALAIGDVVGRGLRAAATMGQLRTALRAYALQEVSPTRVIGLLGGLAKELPEAEMATLVYAVYQPESGLMGYMSAGHPPPLLIRPDGTATYLDEGRVTPLGVPSFVSAEGVVAVEPGTVLIFYTDGLIEKPGSTLDEGMRALSEVALSVPGADPDELCDAILAAMIGDSAPRDDAALLVVSCSLGLSDQLRLSLPADPVRLRGMRQALSRWLVHAGASVDERHEIVLAAAEAATNSMLHAYGAQDGVVDVEAAADGRAVTIWVRDRGSWRSRATTGGRGLSLMQALVEDCEVLTGQEGTQVRLRRRLGLPMQRSDAPAWPVELLAGAPDPGRDDAIAVARIAEEIDVSNADHIGATLAGSVHNDQLGLVVDLSELPFLDSSGVRLLFDLKRRLDRRSQKLWVVVPMDSPIRRVFELTRVGGIIAVASTLDAALDGMREQMARFPESTGGLAN